MWKDKLMDFMMKFSYSERRQNKLKRFVKEVNHYKEMDQEELKFEYIKVKTDFEHQRLVCALFFMIFMISIVTNVGKGSFEYMKMLLEYSATQEDGAVVVQVGMEIFVILLGALMFIMLWILFEKTKEVKALQRKLIIIKMIIQE